MATLLNDSRTAWAHPREAEYPSAEVRALEGELRKRLDGEVRFDDGSRALYATDGSNYRQVPIGVIVPKTVEDVVVTVEQCRRGRRANRLGFTSQPPRSLCGRAHSDRH